MLNGTEIWLPGKPHNLPRINTANPLTAGLVFAGPFGNNQDQAIVRDDKGAFLGVSSQRSELTVVSTPKGLGVSNPDQDGGGQHWQSRRVFKEDGDGSIIVYARPAGANVRRMWTQLDFESAFAHFSLASNSGETGNTSAGRFAIIMDDGTNKTGRTSSAATYIDGDWHWYGGSLTPTVAPELFFDGSSISGGGSATADPSGWTDTNSGDQDICLCNHGRTYTDSMQGELAIALVWDRYLSPFEHRLVTQQFERLFIPNDLDLYAATGGGGGGLSIPIAQAHARRRR